MYRPNASSLSDSRPFRDAESQIRDLTQDFAISFNTGNYDQAVGMFANDGVLMVPHHQAAYGQKSVERLLRRIGETEYGGLRLDTTRVEHSGDMALFGFFVISAQLRLSGFYDKVAESLANQLGHPARFLLILMLATGGLSAV